MMRPISGLRLLPLLVLSIASCGDHRDLAPFNFTASVARGKSFYGWSCEIKRHGESCCPGFGSASRRSREA